MILEHSNRTELEVKKTEETRKDPPMTLTHISLMFRIIFQLFDSLSTSGKCRAYAKKNLKVSKNTGLD